jgi:hypothetical protein
MNFPCLPTSAEVAPKEVQLRHWLVTNQFKRQPNIIYSIMEYKKVSTTNEICISEDIFVSIASYRDPELENTIIDLFKKAKEPARIKIGICLQDTDEYYNNFPFKDHAQIKIAFIENVNARGVCYARSKIQKELLENEQYYLQIDSHTRFSYNWDTQLIEQLKSCNDKKAILSCYPNPYRLDDTNEQYLKNKQLSPHRYIRFESGCIRSNTSGLANLNIVPSKWIAAGFLFTYTDWCREVGYPKNIFFNGEEDYLLIKSFLQNYNIYCPPISSVFHCYTIAKTYSRNLLHEDIDIGTINVSNQELTDLISSISDEQNEEFKKLYGACYKTKTLLGQVNIQTDKIKSYTDYKIHDNKLNIFLWAISNDEIRVKKTLEKSIITGNKYALNIQLLGLDYDIGFLDGFSWQTALAKLYLIKDVTNNDTQNNIVMFLEGERTLFNGTEDLILERFKKMDTKILFGAGQDFIYQWSEYRKNFENEKGIYKYISPGNIIGYSKYLNIMACECIKYLEDSHGNDRGNEYGLLGKYMHENMGGVGLIKLDTKCELFWVVCRDRTFFENNYNFNNITKTSPIIFNIPFGTDELYEQTFHKINNNYLDETESGV